MRGQLVQRTWVPDPGLYAPAGAVSGRVNHGYEGVIRELPPGSYRVRVIHSRTHGSAATYRIRPDTVVTVR